MQITRKLPIVFRSTRHNRRPNFRGTLNASTKANIEAGKSDKLTGSAEPSPTS